MPKMKTHKGTVKRFRFTGSGKPVQSQGRKGHFRRRKAPRVLRQLDRMLEVDKTNVKKVKRLLPYGS